MCVVQAGSHLLWGCEDDRDRALEATAMNTQVTPIKWQALFTEHPNQQLVKFFITGTELALTIPNDPYDQPRRICPVLHSTL